LASLKRALPESVPLSGLAISALGDHVVVRDGEARWQAESGQYVLGLDVTVEDGVLRVVEHKAPAAAAPAGAAAGERDRVAPALSLEDSDPRGALEAYRQAAESEPENVATWTNWGRLLHEQGKAQEASDVYQRGLSRAGRDPLLLFNHGVLLED